MGLPPDDDSFDPEKTIAEWYHEQGLTRPSARPLRKNISLQKDKTKKPASGRKKGSPNKDKYFVGKFMIYIKQTPAHGYLAYCPAVNGKRLHGETIAEAWEKMAAYLGNHLEKLVAKDKPLPKASTRMKK